MRKKAQIISLDLVIGIIVFIIVLTIFIGVFLYGRLTQKVDKYEYELDYLYRNIEKNLIGFSEEEQFLIRARVHKDKLTNFESRPDVNEIIDIITIGSYGDAKGIGLDPAAYDVCLYFTDNDGLPLTLDSGNKYLGRVNYDDQIKTCEEIINFNLNPCEQYKEAISLFKPVIFDEGNFNENRILQMNLVVCKI